MRPYHQHNCVVQSLRQKFNLSCGKPSTYLRAYSNNRRVADVAMCFYFDRTGAEEQRIR